MYGPLTIPTQDREDICDSLEYFPGICKWNQKLGFYVPYQKVIVERRNATIEPPLTSWRAIIRLKITPSATIGSTGSAPSPIFFPFLIDSGAHTTMLPRPRNKDIEPAFPVADAFGKSPILIGGISGRVPCRFFENTHLSLSPHKFYQHLYPSTELTDANTGIDIAVAEDWDFEFGLLGMDVLSRIETVFDREGYVSLWP